MDLMLYVLHQRSNMICISFACLWYFQLLLPTRLFFQCFVYLKWINLGSSRNHYSVNRYGEVTSKLTIGRKQHFPQKVTHLFYWNLLVIHTGNYYATRTGNSSFISKIFCSWFFTTKTNMPLLFWVVILQVCLNLKIFVNYTDEYSPHKMYLSIQPYTDYYLH